MTPLAPSLRAAVTCHEIKEKSQIWNTSLLSFWGLIVLNWTGNFLLCQNIPANNILSLDQRCVIKKIENLILIAK